MKRLLKKTTAIIAACLTLMGDPAQPVYAGEPAAGELLEEETSIFGSYVKSITFASENSEKADIFAYEKTSEDPGLQTFDYFMPVADTAGHNVFVTVELTDEALQLPVKCTFKDLNNNNEKNLTLENGVTKGLTRAIKRGPLGNEIVITIGETSPQIYKFNIERIPSLKSLKIEDADKNAINLKNDFETGVYSYAAVTSADVIRLIAVGSYEGYEIHINGKSENELALAGGENIITVTAENPQTNLESEKYVLTVEKKEKVHITISVLPQEATVDLRDDSNERIWPEDDGSYVLTSGEKYSITVSAYKYVSESGEFVAGLSSELRYDLKYAAETGIEDIQKTTDWPFYRADETNNGVVDCKTPISAQNTSLYWASTLGEGYGNGAVGCPIIVDGYIYTYAMNKILKADAVTGKVVMTGDMAGASSFAINSPAYAEGMIFVALSDGRIQAFDAKTLESLWLYSDPLKGQPNAPIVYHGGYIYTGFWVSESAPANFVCLSVTDEDPSQPLEAKKAAWTYKAKGFYWAGAYACDDFVVVGTDDGSEGYDSGFAQLLSFSPRSGKLLDSITLDTVGDIRCSICYDKKTDAYFFTTKGGYFYRVKIGKDGRFVTGSLRKITLTNGTDTAAMSTSTPVVYNARAYVGVSGNGQFDAYSGHNITVIDLEKFEVAYTAATKGYPQTSGLISTAYEKESGYVYVYFTDNFTPGMVRCIKDAPGVTKVLDPVIEEYNDHGVKKYCECAPVLFTPVGSEAQYCICSPIVDEYGTLYFKNDSAKMMAVGADIVGIEVTRLPDRTGYLPGEKFDLKGAVVMARLANGLSKDVTDYVTFSEDPLYEEDTEVAVIFDKLMYGDRISEIDGKMHYGTALDPLMAFIDITVSDKNGLVKDPDGAFRYYRYGVWQKSYTGYINTNGETASLYQYKIADGVLDEDYEGLYKVDGVWRYYRYGKFQATTTGFATDMTRYNAGQGIYRYRIEKGLINFHFTAFAETENARYYENGRWMNTYTGYANNTQSLGTTYEFYVKNGTIDSNYEGLYKVEGVWRYYRYGRFQATTTGFATDMTRYNAGQGLYRYRIEKGLINFHFTALAETNNKRYYKDGRWMNTFSGTVTIDGETYRIKNGTVI